MGHTEAQQWVEGNGTERRKGASMGIRRDKELILPYISCRQLGIMRHPLAHIHYAHYKTLMIQPHHDQAKLQNRSPVLVEILTSQKPSFIREQDLQVQSEMAHRLALIKVPEGLTSIAVLVEAVEETLHDLGVSHLQSYSAEHLIGLLPPEYHDCPAETTKREEL